MRSPAIALLALLGTTPFSVGAIPATSQCPSRSPWRAFSDSIIRRVWNWEEKKPSTGIYPGEVIRSGGGVTGKLLASYGDDVVLRFNVTTPVEAIALSEAANTLYLDVWEYNADWVDLRMAKDVLPSLLGLLPSTLQTAHRPLLEGISLAQAISNSYPSARSSNPSLSPAHDHPAFTPSFRHPLHTKDEQSNIFFQDYQPLSVITPWMRLLASMFPTHVRLINIGITYEGRDIPALRIGVHPTNNEKPLGRRRTIIIAGGSHAREWISTSTVTYVAYSLITSYGKSSTTKNLLEAFDWVFIPTLNPDGYMYSWETDRLWRKNRQPTSLRFCRGVDLDRSYSFKWDGERSSGNPCSESFAGEAPFEGIEAKRFADWARNETENNNVKFEAFIDLHSYSQHILYPYSYSCSADPPTLENLEELAMGLAKAMRISKGQNYRVTSACEGNFNMKGKKMMFPRMETGGGSALDWFYHELSAYAYQIKLRDTGSYGFLLPKEHIVPSGQEVVGAVEYLGRYLLGEVGLEAEEEGDLGGDDERHISKDGGQTVMGLKPQDANDEEEVHVEEYDSMEIQWELKRRRKR